MSTDVEQNDSLGKDRELVLSLIQFSFTVSPPPHRVVHSKYLETDVLTNQKVVIKHPVG